MVLSKITGLGKQTIEALKHSLINFATGTNSRLDRLERGWTAVTVTLENASATLLVDVPDTAEEVIGWAVTAQQATTVNGYIQAGTAGTNLISTAAVVHAARNQNMGFIMRKTVKDTTGFYIEMARAAGTNDPYSNLAMVLEPKHIDKFAKVGYHINSGTFAVGDSITVFYR